LVGKAPQNKAVVKIEELVIDWVGPKKSTIFPKTLSLGFL
jgi:hypothetical protein